MWWQVCVLWGRCGRRRRAGPMSAGTATNIRCSYISGSTCCRRRMGRRAGAGGIQRADTILCGNLQRLVCPHGLDVRSPGVRCGGHSAPCARGGMRSVVFTAKHHDGFCMFRTATTDFNSWDATPVARDFVGELAEACRREGLRLGIYFSNIDWHYPCRLPHFEP